MIELSEGLPHNVVVARARGKVGAADYESVLMPALSRAVEGGGKVRLLFVLGADFEGYDAEAALDDAELGMQHWTAFERIGLVTDHEAYRLMAKAFGFLMPGEVRVFSVAEESDAQAWVTAD